MNYLNIDVINQNSKYLYKIYKKIHNLFLKSKSILNFNFKKTSDNHITDFLNEHYNNNSHILQFITKNLYLLSHNNIEILFFDKNTKIIKYLSYIFIITFILQQLFNIKHNILIVWIPVDINRDFNFDSINSVSLQQTTENYTAFVSSGFTTSFNHNNIDKKLTVITRFEEIHKLLIHELIHNFCLDGSCKHSQQKQNIILYNTIKNNKNFNYEFCIYESYTELLSSYYQILFFILFFHSSNTNILSLIKKFIINEIHYSFNLIANLIKLNNLTFSQFISNPVFIGDICFYEYYFVKSLLYNHLVLSNFNSNFIRLYQEIINIIINLNKNQNSNSHKLLKHFYLNLTKISNFKYCHLSLL